MVHSEQNRIDNMWGEKASLKSVFQLITEATIFVETLDILEKYTQETERINHDPSTLETIL